MSEDELMSCMGLRHCTTGKDGVNLHGTNIRPLEVFMCCLVRRRWGTGGLPVAVAVHQVESQGDETICITTMIEGLRNIWQHVVRKRKGDCDEEEDGHALTPKKPVMVWSVEIHQQFVAAVNQLGITKAVPTEITKLMNVPGLTSEDVAIHLQKYHNYLRRLSSKLDRPAGANGPIISTHSAASRTISSQSSHNPLAPAANHQLPAHPCQDGISTSTREDTKLWLGE
ncbi:hypothetical protein MLD38_017961 [Melastoma candidum]|uniref:Uncharacterized protein n=1 Tax=Melastoma candidum TaxID=119954 RepID=A0ACB9QTG1_9MYRT|nr:hypothetical protein MLD38_017961 [Melastoma candidum]